MFIKKKNPDGYTIKTVNKTVFDILSAMVALSPGVT